MSLYNFIAVPLSVISGLWIPCTLLCCIPWVQKQYVLIPVADPPHSLMTQDVVSALGDAVPWEMVD